MATRNPCRSYWIENTFVVSSLLDQAFALQACQQRYDRSSEWLISRGDQRYNLLGGAVAIAQQPDDRGPRIEGVDLAPRWILQNGTVFQLEEA